MESSCPNCGVPLGGEWCHGCGQRRIHPEHRRLRWLLAQLVSGITSLDSKFLRSVLALVVRPGKLGAEWLAGRRARWIAPVGLFLFVNVLYFVAPPVTDFSLPLSDQLNGSAHSGYATRLVERRMPGVADWIARGKPSEGDRRFERFERQYETRSGSLSKTLLILHVPLMAFALWLLYRRRKIFYVDHFAIALHYWSFMLLMLMVVPRASEWIAPALVRLGIARDVQSTLVFWKTGLLVLMVGHLILAVRRAYGDRLWMAAPKAAAAFLTCVAAHALYRPILFSLTVWTI